MILARRKVSSLILGVRRVSRVEISCPRLLRLSLENLCLQPKTCRLNSLNQAWDFVLLMYGLFAMVIVRTLLYFPVNA